tara:strand:+ start:209 stop:358 length:150 start_codon:yes stop_codon:yes gene_type:complete
VGEIDSKYEKNGEYFFALVLKNTGNNEDAGRVYRDVSVKKNSIFIKRYW